MARKPVPDSLPVTSRLADFIAAAAFDDIPKEAIELGRKSILDCLGVALSGSTAEGSRILRKYLAASGSVGGASTVIGASDTLPPFLGALVNGAAMHADDYDDTLRPGANDEYRGSVHPTTPVLAALLAVADINGASGRDIMTAYQAGVETMAKINDSISGRHFAGGFHPTATVGCFGAAVAASKLLDASSEDICTALGIAASGASGLRANFGSMMKPYHAGHAAKTGLTAAQLARAGFTATVNVLESTTGFFSAYGDGFDARHIWERLGGPWSIVDPGIWLKPHPSGMRTHQAMTRLLKLIGERGLTADQVTGIRVRSHEGVYRTLIHHRPKTGLEGKFSMEFCLAVLLVEGRAGLAQFTDQVVNRAEVQELVRRIDYGPFTEAEALENGYTNVTTTLEIDLKCGETVTARADVGRGSTALPMTWEDVADKVRDCARVADWPGDKVEAIIDMAAGFEELDDVRRLTALLKCPASSP